MNSTDVIITCLVIILILYVMDRQYVGFFPDVFKPWQQIRSLSKLRKELFVNPHNVTLKLAAARILIDRKRYNDAKSELLEIVKSVNESAEVVYDLGLCYVKLGKLDEGEKYMLQSMQINPRVRYGEAYLRLAEAYSKENIDRAIDYLQKFKQFHNSSCEAYFRLGLLYEKLDKKAEAAEAFRETLNIYRSLPKYKRKSERKWMILAGLKGNGRP